MVMGSNPTDTQSTRKNKKTHKKRNMHFAYHHEAASSDCSIPGPGNDDLMIDRHITIVLFINSVVPCKKKRS